MLLNMHTLPADLGALAATGRLLPPIRLVACHASRARTFSTGALCNACILCLDTVAVGCRLGFHVVPDSYHKGNLGYNCVVHYSW